MSAVQVTVGSTTYLATVTTGVWSVTVPLVPGQNIINVKAYPINTLLCQIQETSITLNYYDVSIPEETTCSTTNLNPAEVQVNNGLFTITCS